MSLIKCNDCGNTMSTKAAQCPTCGAPGKKGMSIMKLIGIVFFGIIVINVIGVTLNTNREPPKTTHKILGPQERRPAPTIKKQTQKPQRKTPAPPAEASITVTARNLHTAYQANEVAADMRYKGKIALIDGRVSDVGVVLGKTYVSLETDSMFMSVRCSTPKSENYKVSRLKKGEMILVKGKIDGKSIGVSVSNCTIVKLP